MINEDIIKAILLMFREFDYERMGPEFELRLAKRIIEIFITNGWSSNNDE